MSFPSLEIVDMDGNVNEWNNKTAEITGFTKEEALNRPLVTTFIMPKLRRSVQEVMDNALQGNETSNYELGEDGFIGCCLTAYFVSLRLFLTHSPFSSLHSTEFWTKSNETRYLLVNATTRRDEDNNIVGVVGVAQVSSFIVICSIGSIGIVSSFVPYFYTFCPRSSPFQ